MREGGKSLHIEALSARSKPEIKTNIYLCISHVALDNFIPTEASK